MKVTIVFRGQLADAAGAGRSEREVDPAESLASLIADLVSEMGEGFREIVCDADGRQRRTLLVATDGEQVVDFDAALGEGVREITLMPPIAGG